jgi:[acyl-carrier-protein] S-malonyltransferase
MSQVAVNGPLMYVANCAAYEMLKIQHPKIAEKVQGIAGYSVGEFTALYAAEVITFEQGLAIVKARAEAQQEALDGTEMAAMVFDGLELARVEGMCTRAIKKDTEAGAQAAVVAQNGASHSFVAGKKSTMAAVEEAAKKEKDREGVKQISTLSYIPAGSPLLAEANEKVAKAIDRTLPAMNPPRCELYLNATGWRVAPGTSPAKFVSALKEQLESPIMWEGTIDQCMRWGIREFYECGPGKSLKNFMKDTEFLEECPLVIVKPVESVTNISV